MDNPVSSRVFIGAAGSLLATLVFIVVTDIIDDIYILPVLVCIFIIFLTLGVASEKIQSPPDKSHSQSPNHASNPLSSHERSDTTLISIESQEISNTLMDAKDYIYGLINGHTFSFGERYHQIVEKLELIVSRYEFPGTGEILTSFKKCQGCDEVSLNQLTHDIIYVIDVLGRTIL